MVKVFIFKALLMFVFPFYRVNLPNISLPDEVKMTIHHKEKPAQVRIIKRGEREYLRLEKMLKTESDGWSYSLINLAPGVVYRWDAGYVNCRGMAAEVEVKDPLSGEAPTFGKRNLRESCADE